MANEIPDALRRLDVLVGEWDTEAPAMDARGRTSFAWLDGGGFLIERSVVQRPEFPNSISIIGTTGRHGALQQHYFDSRGVARVYEMSLEGGIWTLYRAGPDWPQRYVGRLSEDANTITGAWERGDEPGADLQHDFDLTFTRLR